MAVGVGVVNRPVPQPVRKVEINKQLMRTSKVRLRMNSPKKEMRINYIRISDWLLNGSKLGQQDPLLILVFALAVSVGDFTDFVALEEEHLGDAFVGIDLGRQRGGVGDLKGNVAFPFWLKRGDVDDNAAAGICALANTNGQGVTRNAEILHGARQGKGIGWNNAHVAVEIDHRFRIKILGVHGH
ncbi:hypothetical protein SDC9_153609 [bioreactor metagenome]|uniref:Uncharacterized protein n=1 Tax=bioreactor metagenome TaxID=1076179 RepID=A0A645F119_9ZZZZ